jgi:tRNA(Ile)-lysidine synthase
MLEAILRSQCALDPRRPVLVGVSGGPDSLCLLGGLHAAGYPVIVAHFNHKLRPEADEDAGFVADHARSLGLPCVTESADVAAYAAGQGLSIEEAARILRYRFLFAAARKNAAQAVAVGHTADDQVETVLMHFLRGAGLDGLKGMEYRSLLPAFDPEIPLVRPLLSLWREDTEGYCREHGLSPRLDASNADPAYFRNRLRLELIPILTRYNPQFKSALLRSAAALQGDHDLLRESVEAACRETCRESGEGWIAFDADRLAGLSPAMRRNLIRTAGETLRPESSDFGFEALLRVADFAGQPAPGKQVDFACGLYLFAEPGRVVLAAYEADLRSAAWPQVDSAVEIGAAALDLGDGWTLAIERLDLDAPRLELPGDTWSAWLDADALNGPLTVRAPRPGDRFQPLGMPDGSLKLSDFFINVKLPKRARAHWPLVCSGDRIVWVPGYRPAHAARGTEATRRVLKMSLKKL